MLQPEIDLKQIIAMSEDTDWFDKFRASSMVNGPVYSFGVDFEVDYKLRGLTHLEVHKLVIANIVGDTGQWRVLSTMRRRRVRSSALDWAETTWLSVVWTCAPSGEFAMLEISTTYDDHKKELTYAGNSRALGCNEKTVEWLRERIETLTKKEKKKEKEEE